MKTIQVSDEDYKTLMELSRELQLQDNDCQAFPYFWEPASEKLEISTNDEGEVIKLYDRVWGESFTPEEYASNEQKTYDSFITEYHGDEEYHNTTYDLDLESEWLDYLNETHGDIIEIYSEDWTHQTEHNPSFFKSDVKNFIEGNTKWLGRNTHTYARTVFRMPKMTKLITAIYRLNPQSSDEINQEAKRIVFNKGGNK